MKIFKKKSRYRNSANVSNLLVGVRRLQPEMPLGIAILAAVNPLILILLRLLDGPHQLVRAGLGLFDALQQLDRRHLRNALPAVFLGTRGEGRARPRAAAASGSAA